MGLSKAEDKMIGDIITLKGKSQKGKNKIREHGNKWRVIKETATLQLIEPIEQRNPNKPEIRWINYVYIDPNFKRE